MVAPSTKTRQQLRSRFVRGVIPTEADFSDLIGASLNQADDGVFKLPNEPLSLVRQSATQPVLRLYDDATATTAAWQIGLQADTAAGLTISNKDGKVGLFLDQASGSMGVGTGSPAACLTVHSELWPKQTTKDPQSSLSFGGHLAIRSPSPQLDFIHTNSTMDWAIHVNEGRMYFIRSPWEHQIFCLDGNTCNVGIGTSSPAQKLHVAGTAQITSIITDSLTVGGKKLDGSSALGDKITILDNGNVGVGEINPVARLTVFRDGNVWDNPSRDPASNLTCGGQLAIKGRQPQLDFIDMDPNAVDWAIHVNDGNMWFLRSPWVDTGLILCADGQVGIGTTAPEAKLHVNGDLRCGSGLCDRLRIGKFHLNSGSDDWLRLYDQFNANQPNISYYSNLGFAASKFWCLSGGNYTSSDLRCKNEDSIQPLAGAAEMVKRLKPVRFRYKDQQAEALPKLGFIAQDMEALLPEAVGIGPDGMKGIQDSCVIALLAQALKELQGELEDLRARMTTAQ